LGSQAGAWEPDIGISEKCQKHSFCSSFSSIGPLCRECSWFLSTKRRIVVAEEGPVSVVRFVDKKIVDSASIEALGEELNALVLVDKITIILLNFEGVEFMSSAALNKLISLNSKLKAAQGRLKLCNLRAEIKEVFTITRLDRVFDIRKTEPEALEAFKL
jgi:anti-sigma B factor antagonist